MDARRSSLSLPLSLLFLLLAACGGSGDDRTVKDQAGRTCTIPADGLTITCDAQPMPSQPCTNGGTACFVTGTADDTTSSIGPAAVCAACCTGKQSIGQGADCSPIVCTTVEDCPLGSTSCDSGRCF